MCDCDVAVVVVFKKKIHSKFITKDSDLERFLSPALEEFQGKSESKKEVEVQCNLTINKELSLLTDRSEEERNMLKNKKD